MNPERIERDTFGDIGVPADYERAQEELEREPDRYFKRPSTSRA